MPSLSPCIAIVGPANAGKTTLLHQLDEKLKAHLDSFLVIKGSPDGTGRYFYHAPDLRNEPTFKASVKGKWGDGTIERICEWVEHGRRNLSLALLDFGGRHDEQTADGNARMLKGCSHYIVVSRQSDPGGAKLWDDVCRSHDLTRLAWMQSQPRDSTDLEAGESTFQVNTEPGDTRNDASLAPVVKMLLDLSHPPDQTPYVNLRQSGDWLLSQIPDVAGQASKIEELASRTGVVVLGGAAPIWAYLAGLRCALKARKDARVFFFDPRQPERLVEIPRQPGRGSDSPGLFPENALQLHWRADETRSILQLEICTHDKFLPPSAAQNLAGAPVPPPPPSGDVGLSGAGPTWLFGTYARWLMAAGVSRLASWDGRSKSFVQVWQ